MLERCSAARGRCRFAPRRALRLSSAARGLRPRVGERRVEDSYLRGRARLFEKVVGVGLDLALDHLLLNLVANVFEFGDGATGRPPPEPRDERVAVVSLNVRLRDDGEGAEAEVEVLLDADSVLHDLAEDRKSTRL